MDFQDYNWNEPYARCAAKHDDAAIESLHDSYLDAADESIRVYRQIAQTLYHRDVPYVLLMHVGAFDAHMLPELIRLFRSRGFSFVTLQQAMADPIYSFDPKVTSPGGNTFNEMVAQSAQRQHARYDGSLERARRDVSLNFQPDHSHQRDAIPRRYDAIAQLEVETHLAILYPLLEVHIAKRVRAVSNRRQCKIVRAD